MIRTFESFAVNQIANDPEVRPWLGGQGSLDLTPVVENPDNFCLLTPNHDGAYVLTRLDLGLYEAHSLSLKSARGRSMLDLMKDGFRYLLTATECIEICTKIPDGNDAASRWADLAGFRPVGYRPECFDLDGKMVGCSFRTLTYRDWVVRDKRNQREGEAFHAKLQTIKASALHPDDPVHDAYVGATLEGVRQGNAAKAIALYSRWAVQMGYHVPALLSLHPPTVHQGDAVVSMIDGQIFLLKVFDTPEG